jgi:DNA processing protein
MDADFLRLVAHQGLGFQGYQALLSHYGSDQAALRAGVNSWQAKGLVRANVAECPASMQRALDAWLASPDQQIITWLDAAYPERLREIDSPPLMLFVKGDVALLSSFQLAVVGSRSASGQAQRLTQLLVEPMAARGWTITSGLALGVDGWAHEAALAVRGKTLAVLGGGLNALYPKSHVKLAQRIVEQGGALVSEQLPDTPAKAGFFPLRNRIVSGLSEGVLVVEASQKSGSLITARLANEAGRQVFAVPCSPLNLKGLGCLDLLAQGAGLVREARDLYEPLEQGLLHRMGIAPDDLGNLSSEQNAQQALAPSLSGEEQRIIDRLGELAVHPSDLARELGLEVGLLSQLLMELDEKGQIGWVAGGRVQVMAG